MFTCAWAEETVLHFSPILSEFFKSTAAILENSDQMRLLYGWSSFSRKLFNASEWFHNKLWFCCKHRHHKCTHISVQMTICSSLSLMARFALAKCRSFRSSFLLLLSSSHAAVFSSRLLCGHLHFAPVPRSSAARILTLPIKCKGEWYIPYFGINLKASIFDKVNSPA